METKKWVIAPEEVTPEHPAIREAAALLAAKEVVAFPTETVYGLGGDGYSDEAIAKIYQAKGRPADNPLILHFFAPEQIAEVATQIPPMAVRLLSAFTPGPLTLILPSNGRASKLATAGGETVAVRIPSHPVARALLQAVGRPLAAPSANRSGRPSPTKASHVFDDLNGRIAGLIDGGETGIGLESTVLDITVSPPQILRPGGVTQEALREVIGEVICDPGLTAKDKAPKAPGMKYTHYAPKAPFYMVSDDGERSRTERMAKEIMRLIGEGKRVGIMTTDESVPYFEAALPGKEGEGWIILSLGRRPHLEEAARHLYDTLRTFDMLGVDVIIGEGFPEKGLGAALMNRLKKAATMLLPPPGTPPVM